MAKFRLNDITLRYCHLTSEDPNYGGYKCTAEVPRDMHQRLVAAVTQQLPSMVDKSKKLSRSEGDLILDLDVGDAFINKTDDDNPDIVLVNFKSGSADYFTIVNEDGTTFDNTLMHGARVRLEFTVVPNVVKGTGYLSRYINRVVVLENGDGGADVIDIDSDSSNVQEI